MDRSKRQGILAIFTANTIFGLNIPVTKALMQQWMTPMGYTLTRMVFGTVLFWSIGFLLKEGRVEKRDLWIILVGGLLGFLGTQFLFSQSLEYTSPVIFALIMALTPVVVIVLSAIFLRESVSMRKIFGIALSISGAAWAILSSAGGDHQGSNHVLGIVLALLCVVSYGSYMVMTRKVSVKYPPVTIAKWMFLVSAVVAFPLAFQETPTQEIFSDRTTFTALLLLAFALIFSTTIAFFLMPYALKRLEAGTVSVFMNIQPISASAVAIWVGQDSFSWTMVLAAFVVISGVYLVTRE